MNKDIILAIVAGTILLTTLVLFFVLILSSYNKRKIKYIRESSEKEMRFKTELINSKLATQEQTLLQISQDIHDNVGQILSLVKLQLNTLQHTANEPNDKINSSIELLSKAINDLRDISKSMNGNYLQSITLFEAIKREVSFLQRSNTYTIETEIQNETLQFSHDKNIILFRMFQEIINNIIKHANASVIKIKSDTYDNRFFLTVQDNGCGFSTEVANTSLGLINLKNRAELLNGYITFESIPQKGTTVSIAVPL